MPEADTGPRQEDSSSTAHTVSWGGRPDAVPVRAAPAAPPQFPDHEVLGLLGAGGMGVVYKARDLQRGTLVALKTLLHYGAADLYRFKQEFRALADLNHPNLVVLYQLLSTGEQWCFTMELVEGLPFLNAIQVIPPSEGHPTIPEGLTASDLPAAAAEPTIAQSFDEDRLRDALRQLGEGLCFLHAHGKLHCDLKPSNVLVDREGRVVILDFGLAQESATVQEAEAVSVSVPEGEETARNAHLLTWTHGGLIRGTIVYMSPEQAAGLPLSPASDWYAVGVMLYQALTGRLPFRGGLEVLKRKQMEDPPPPSAFVPDLPADLECLCLELLRRDPESRPDGRQVLARLGRTPQPVPAPHPSTSGAMPFVGRSAQFALLRQAWQETLAGQAKLVLVQEPSGAGKSTLLQRFLAELAATHALVLRGRCFEQESVPFKAVDALMDHLSHTLKGLPGEEAAELLPPGTVALAQMFPVLKRATAVAHALAQGGPSLDGQELRRQGFAALRELLARLGKKRPLALWVDDLQWGDLDSAELLASLLQGPSPPPALFLLSYRGEYSSSSVCLRTLFALLEENSGVVPQEVPVEPLTSEEAAELARQLLGSAAAEQAGRIARESGGNPYFVHELARHVQAGEAFAAGETSAAIQLDEVIWSRVRRLPEPARVLLEVLAVAGQPLQQNVACQAAHLQDDRRFLGMLRAENLVRGSGLRPEDEVETFHDRIRESIRARVPQEVQQRHHEQLALTLESVPGTDPERLAVHFAAAGERSKAGTYFARAGEAAAAALAFDLAAAHFRQAIEHGPADEEAARRLRRQLGEALANAGRGAEAAEAYLAAAEGAWPRESILLRGRAGSQLLFAGRTDEGLAVLQEVLASAGMRPRPTVVGTVVSLYWNKFKLWLRGMKFREVAESGLKDDDRLRLDIAWSGAIGLSIVDPIRGYDLHSRALLQVLRLGEPNRISRAVSMVAGHMSAEGSGKKKRVLELLEFSEALARKTGQPYSMGVVLHDRGVSSFLFTQFRQAVEQNDQAEVEYKKCTGVAWEIDTVRTFALWSLGYLGELGELRRRQERLVKEARERNARYALTNFLTYVTLYAPLAADDPDAAREQLEEARQGWTPRGFYVQTHAMDGGQILLDFYLGRAQAVWDLVRSKWWGYHRSVLMQCQIIRTFLLYARGASALALSAGTDSPRSWLRRTEKDGKRLEREGTLWAAALGRVLRGGVSVRRGDTESAVMHLQQAVEWFDQVGAQLYAAAARRRLGALMGGDRGRELLQQAASMLAAQQVRSPDRLTAMLTPGYPALT